MQHFRTFLLPSLLIALGTSSVRSQGPPAEPVHARRTLSAWIKDLGDTNVLVREEALEALGRLGGEAKKATDAIRPLLKDPLTTTRLRAAIALGRIEQNPAGVLPVIKDAVRDATRSTRLLVLEALQEADLDRKETAPLFVELLTESDLTLRERARFALQTMGTDALPAMLAALKHDNAELVRTLLIQIGSLGPKAESATDPLRDLLKHRDALCRLAAANALWYVAKDSESTLPVILALVRDPANGLARPQAMHLLLQFKPIPKSAVPVLEAALEDRDATIKARAAEALWDFDGRTKSTLPVLFAAFRDTRDFSARSVARTALCRMKAHAKEIVPVIIEIARTSIETRVPFADCGMILSQMGDEAVGTLEGLLKEKDHTLRQMALTALCDSGEKGAAVLVAMLPKADVDDQVMICQILGRSRGNSERAVLVVAELLKSGNQSVVNAAAGALITFGPRAAPAAAQLAGLLKDPNTAQNLRFRLSTLFMNIGPAGKAAVPTLVEVIKDDKSQDWARQQALLSLGQIGPAARDALPAVLEAYKTAKVQDRGVFLNAIFDIDPFQEAIVPALLAVLKAPETRGTAIRASASTLLGNCAGDPKVIVPALLEALKENPQSFQRREIAVALGKIGPAAREAIPALKELLNTIEEPYVVEVANTLTILGCTEREVVQALVRQASNAQSHNRLVATTALLRVVRASSSFSEELLKAWRTEANQAERLRLAELIAVLDSKAAREMTPWLKQQLATPYYGHSAAVVFWRIDSRHAEGLPYLRRLLKSSVNYERGYGAQGLGEIGPPARDAVAELEAFLKLRVDPNISPLLRQAQEVELMSLRVYAARALVRIDPRKATQAIAVLSDAVREQSVNLGYYRTQAIEGLAALGPEAASALPALAEAYRKSAAAQRRSILDAMRKIDAEKIAKLLR
jgi:HEAT repeat protein